MTTTKPDRRTLLTAIRLANRAPSAWNSQPWRWLVGDATVHLLADWSRHVPGTDVDGRDLLLGCGAALHHLRTAFAGLGWATVVHRVPDDRDPGHLATVEARPHVPTEDDVSLVNAISRRRTATRFSSWAVPAAFLDLMVRRAARAGALLTPVTDGASRWLLARAATGTRDGVLRPAYAERHGGTAVRVLPGGALLNTVRRRGTEDAAELLVVATLLDDQESVLRAGEATSAALLTAADLGLATCRLSAPLAQAGTRAEVRDRVLDGVAHPHLVLRAGWARTVVPQPSPGPERRTEDTVGYLPDAP